MAETSRFLDKFDRSDGSIGSNYTEACGAVEIFDEAVWPVEVQVDQSPQILTEQPDHKVQALYTASIMDGPNYSVRGVWFHVDEIPGIQPISDLLTEAASDPSFTLLARMSKDPQLVDLSATAVGGSERSFTFDPQCYDQGYGLRVTCPRDGSAPILKIIKFVPPVLGPGVSSRVTTTEPDNVEVLAQTTLTADQLHVGTVGDATSYRNYNQWMRLRIRRADDHVILEAYFNDRNRHIPILTYTDRMNPLWGEVGVPGIEFLNAVYVNQPTGVSPYSLRGIPVMACQLFEVETIKDYAPPTVSTPSNYDTYQRIAERVALLVEKDGDTIWTATAKSEARIATYLEFVYECEQGLLRGEGYWWFLERSIVFYGESGMADYEMPENLELLYGVTRISEPRRPIEVIHQQDANSIIVNPSQQGSVRLAKLRTGDVNDQRILTLIPTPSADGEQFQVDYYARWIRPTDPRSQIPLVPQAHTDVLRYGAAAHATLHNTDVEDAAAFTQMYQAKVMGLVRVNNRKIQRRTIMRSEADRGDPAIQSLSPLTRAAQLAQNFFSR